MMNRRTHWQHCLSRWFNPVEISHSQNGNLHWIGITSAPNNTFETTVFTVVRDPIQSPTSPVTLSAGTPSASMAKRKSWTLRDECARRLKNITIYHWTQGVHVLFCDEQWNFKNLNVKNPEFQSLENDSCLTVFWVIFPCWNSIHQKSGSLSCGIKTWIWSPHFKGKNLMRFTKFGSQVAMWRPHQWTQPS